MQNPEIEKMEKLEQIAQADEICRLWQESSSRLKAQFDACTGCQPTQSYQLLHSLLEAEQMLACRKLLLACIHMDFKEEQK